MSSHDFLSILLFKTAVFSVCAILCGVILRLSRCRSPKIHIHAYLIVLLLGILGGGIPVSVPVDSSPGQLAQSKIPKTLEFEADPNPVKNGESLIFAQEHKGENFSDTFSAKPPEYSQRQFPSAFPRRPEIFPEVPLQENPRSSGIQPVPDSRDGTVFTGQSDAEGEFETESRVSVFQTALRKFSPGKFLLCIYVLGMVLILAWRAVVHIILQFRLKNAVAVSGRDLRQWNAILQSHAIPEHALPLLLTENLGPGIAWRFFGPVVLLPRDLWEDASPEIREGILRHELAHHLHRDLLRCGFARILALVHWFNPLSWFVLRKLDEATEWNCDLRAFGNLPEGMVRFAESILAVHETRPTILLNRYAFGGGKITRRIHQLQEHFTQSKESMMKKTCITAIVAIVLISGLCQFRLVPRLKAETAPQNTAEQTAAEQSAEENPPQSVPENTITLSFFGPGEKPIPGASGLAWSNPKPKNWNSRRFEFQADEKGTVQIPFEPAENMQTFYVNVKTPGFTPFYAEWEDPKNDPIPERYDFHLKEAGTIGSIVLDEQGKPLPGVKVSTSFPWGDHQRIKRENFGCSVDASTDENGIWKCEYVPLEYLVSQSRTSFEHPDYQKLSVDLHFSQLQPNSAGEFTHTVSMKRGLDITGTVLDEQARPIPGAIVSGSAGTRNYDYQKSTTDENGRFSFKNWPESREEHILVRAEGFAPELRDRMIISENMPPITFTLKSPHTIRVKVLDPEGSPVEKVWFAVERWRTRRLLSEPLFGPNKETDSEGCVVFENAPEDEVVFDLLPTGAGASKYRALRGQTLKARAEPHVLTLQPALRVAGKVIDAKTQQPIGEFKISKGLRFPGQNRTYWDTYRAGFGRDGAFEKRYADENNNFVIKIEAEGYQPSTSREISLSEEFVELEFALEKTIGEPPSGISGLVRFEDQPVSGATVALALKHRTPYIQNGSLLENSNVLSVRTDEQGRFALPPITEEMLEDPWGNSPTEEDPDFKLIVLHPSGFAQISKKEFLEGENTITLGKWARVEGTVNVGLNPGKNLSLNLNRQEEIYWEQPRAYFDYRATSDSRGRFAFEQVPPGEGVVALEIRFGVRDGAFSSCASHGEKVELLSGETATVQIGGIGRPVIGTLVLPEDSGIETDWNFCNVRIRPAVNREPREFPNMDEMNSLRREFEEFLQGETDPEIVKEKMEQWKDTESGKRFEQLTEEFNNEWIPKNRREMQDAYAAQRASAVDGEGNFRIHDVPPGPWTLEVELNAPPPQGQCGFGNQLAHLNRDITVPEIPTAVSEDAYDLQTLQLEKAAEPIRLIGVGETAPDFELKRLFPKKDAEETPPEQIIKLSDYRGKTVVLDFWATWCGPCLEKLPQITRLYEEKIRDAENLELIAISIDAEDGVVEKFLTKQDLPWIQLRFGPGEPSFVEYGISAVPTLIVLDPEGKVLAVDPSMEELEKLLQ